MKTRYIIIACAIALSLISIQLVNANLSTIKADFVKPNIKLQLTNHTVIIPNNVGHLSKSFDHEEFYKLQQEEIKKAETIRDKLINTQERDY